MNTDTATQGLGLPRNSVPRRAIGAAVALAGLVILIGQGLPRF